MIAVFESSNHENKLCEEFVSSLVCCCGVSLYEFNEEGNSNSREAAPPSPAELLVTQRTSAQQDEQTGRSFTCNG